MDENNNECSYRNVTLKANRASETEEQRKERMKMRREKDRARRRTKNYKRKIKSHQKRKSTRNSTWPLSIDCSVVMKMSWREN